MKKKIIFAAVALVIVIAAIFFFLPKDADIKGTVISVTSIVVDMDTDKENVVVSLTDGSKTYYVRITEKTATVNASGKYFPANSLIEGDVVSVWTKNKTTEDNIIDAKKIVFEYNNKKD